MSSAKSGTNLLAQVRKGVRPLTGILVLVLAVQFTIGMIVNLWVKLPSEHPGANADNYFAGVVQGDVWALAASDWPMQLHVVWGIALFIGAILLLTGAISRREKRWIWVASIGLFGITAAGFNGASFLNYGHDFSSMLMSAGFVVALCAYAAGLYFTQPDPR